MRNATFGLLGLLGVGALSAAALADDTIQNSAASDVSASDRPRSHLQWRPYRPELSAPIAADNRVRQISNEEPIDDARDAAPRVNSRRRDSSDLEVVQAPQKSTESLFDPFGGKPNPTNPTAPRANDAAPVTPAEPKNTAPAAKSGDPFGDEVTPATPVTPSRPIPPPQIPPATAPGPAFLPSPGVQPNPVRATPLPDSDLTPRFRATPVPPSQMEPNVPQFSCAPNQKSCEEDLAALFGNTVDKVRLDISVKGTPGNEFPCECSLGNTKFVERDWNCITYTWKASSLCHKPLYFEEPALERYGHSRGPILDPLVSAAHFFVCVPLLPYEMGVALPDECQYSLGYYRPGSCAPWIIDGFPVSLRGAAFEFTFATGAAFAIP